MAAAAVVTFIILPTRVRHAEEEPPTTEKAPPAEGG